MNYNRCHLYYIILVSNISRRYYICMCNGLVTVSTGNTGSHIPRKLHSGVLSNPWLCLYMYIYLTTYINTFTYTIHLDNTPYGLVNPFSHYKHTGFVVSVQFAFEVINKLQFENYLNISPKFLSLHMYPNNRVHTARRCGRRRSKLP